jgi:hypothetical protein
LDQLAAEHFKHQPEKSGRRCGYSPTRGLEPGNNRREHAEQEQREGRCAFALGQAGYRTGFPVEGVDGTLQDWVDAYGWPAGGLFSGLNGRLDSGASFTCLGASSGVLIGRNLFLTAAHNLLATWKTMQGRENNDAMRIFDTSPLEYSVTFVYQWSRTGEVGRFPIDGRTSFPVVPAAGGIQSLDLSGIYDMGISNNTLAARHADVIELAPPELRASLLSRRVSMFDYCVLVLGPNSEGQLPGDIYGYSRLRAWSVARGDWIATIGHPGGHPKRISWGRITSTTGRCANHNTEACFTAHLATIDGNSGGGWFDADGCVRAVHYWSTDSAYEPEAKAVKLGDIVQNSTRMQQIVEAQAPAPSLTPPVAVEYNPPNEPAKMQIFYQDAVHGSILNLRSRRNEIRRVWVHEDLSATCGLPRGGDAGGGLTAWYGQSPPGTRRLFLAWVTRVAMGGGQLNVAMSTDGYQDWEVLPPFALPPRLAGLSSNLFGWDAGGGHFGVLLFWPGLEVASYLYTWRNGRFDAPLRTSVAGSSANDVMGHVEVSSRDVFAAWVSRQRVHVVTHTKAHRLVHYESDDLTGRVWREQDDGLNEVDIAQDVRALRAASVPLAVVGRQPGLMDEVALFGLTRERLYTAYLKTGARRWTVENRSADMVRVAATDRYSAGPGRPVIGSQLCVAVNPVGRTSERHFSVDVAYQVDRGGAHGDFLLVRRFAPEGNRLVPNPVGPVRAQRADEDYGANRLGSQGIPGLIPLVNRAPSPRLWTLRDEDGSGGRVNWFPERTSGRAGMPLGWTYTPRNDPPRPILPDDYED